MITGGIFNRVGKIFSLLLRGPRIRNNPYATAYGLFLRPVLSLGQRTRY